MFPENYVRIKIYILKEKKIIIICEIKCSHVVSRLYKIATPIKKIKVKLKLK